MTGNTIAAVATPPGCGGIGIVRISGEMAFSIASSLFHPRSLVKQSFHPDRIISHHLYYGTIVEPETRNVIDEVLIAFMKAPHSYTREDVVEIQAHSGYAVLKAILQAVLKGGARTAGPGEFTRRAFLNGRIDLTQAEAVIDLINSKTETARISASNHLTGGFRRVIDDIAAGLQDIRVQIEAAIDFPDEVESLPLDSFVSRLETDVLKPIRKLIHHYEDGRVIRDGYRITIIGRPNVGKSSLMNWLVGYERSIVTEIPGTTRDVVTDSVMFQGIPVHFSDTAGIHFTQDVVELLGIEKTYENIRTADLILLVMDASATDCSREEHLLEQIRNIPVIRILNKIDLAPDYDNGIRNVSLDDLPMMSISVKKQLNLESLADRIALEVHQKTADLLDIGWIPNLRQTTALEDAATCVQRALSGIRQNSPAEIIAMDIRDAMERIDEITGIRTAEATLDRIFNTFCIGK
jgi:tRNA modification GTPase